MDNVYVLGPDGELYHHGIKGMRWGFRRFQNRDGSLTTAGRKRYNDELERVKKETSEIKAQQRAQKRTIAKAEKIAQAKKELADLKESGKHLTKETKAAVSGKKVKDVKDIKDKKIETKPVETDSDKKARLLREPNAKEILENRRLFTDGELNSLKLRMATERDIGTFIPTEVSKGEQFVNKFVKTADTVTKVIDSGSKTWNGIAKISNSIFGTDLPTISEKPRTEAEKIREKAELLDAKNKLRKAQLENPDRKKTELEKLEDDYKLQDAKNKLRKSQLEDPDREKTDDEKYAEETARIKAQTERQKAENNRRDADLDKEGLDRRAKKLVDADEADKKAKEKEAREKEAADKKAKKDAEEKAKKDAEEKARKKKDAEEKARDEADEKARKENEERSRREYEEARINEARKNAKGERTVVDPDAKSRPVSADQSLTLYNPTTTALGKAYINRSRSSNSSETYKTPTSIISKIRTLTSGGNETYSEIANQLGVSVSTVQNYSRGRDTVEKLMSYDENNNFIGYWSAIRDDD